MIKKTALIILLALQTVMFVPSSQKRATNLEELSNSEKQQIAEAVNLAATNNTLGMGEGNKMFSSTSLAFNEALSISARSEQSTELFSGSNMLEITTKYDNKFGIGSSIEAKLPVGSVDISIGSSFNKDTSGIKGSVQDEFFEYYEVKKQIKLTQINWSEIDLVNALTNSYKSDLAKVKDLISAKTFLQKYGTHVFDNYYFGGTLSISRYVASTKNIQSEYEAKNLTLNLELSIDEAITTASNYGKFDMSSKEVHSLSTSAKSRVVSKGGNDLNALTVNDLFTYKQEYMSQYETGFIYAAWLNSIAKGDVLRVIDAKRPIAVWDLLSTHNLIDAVSANYFRESFDLITFGSYAENSLAMQENPDYIESLEYVHDGQNNVLDINSNTIMLPTNVTLIFNYSSLLLDNYSSSEITLNHNDSPYATIEDNKLTLKADALNKKITVDILIRDVSVMKYYIIVGVGKFAKGFGTPQQPYLLSDYIEWNKFVSTSEYYDEHFKLISDIDLAGRYFSTGGAEAKREFFGSLDGNGYTIKNATVFAKKDWNHFGLFGVNYGTIKHLKFDNIVVINEENTASNGGAINGGIIAGINLGLIEKVSVTNSAIRIVGQLDKNSKINIGGLVGRNKNTISLSSISNSHIYGISHNGEGTVNVGGLVGYLDEGTIINSYAAANTVYVTNYIQGSDNDWYLNRTNERLYIKENGVWVDRGLFGQGKPKDDKGKDGEYYYDESGEVLYKKDSSWKKLKEKDYTAPNKILSGTVSVLGGEYNLGGLAGRIENNSTVKYVATYKNAYNQSKKAFGNIAGYASSDTRFSNVFYEGSSSNAVNGNAMSGISNARTLTLYEIANNEWANEWTENVDGNPILKWEVENV